ncbi:transcriptional regulator ChbR [Escherichia albertii]|uniref:transcriptional regulator ChbR n=1 Tax=Escherichia albertii TaxID=208962 RepID=UPI0018284C0D|nr:transcriptional regulator ChbR [Escherichia albertii]EFO0970549.1 transcriptional regulator ChbR [Escherichia albertii]MDD9757030.1 transcriptional regulator ChbR [Escherichia albertii]
MEITTVHENQFLNGRDFYMFILDKTESVSGLHQHEYYEFVIVLTGRCSQEINGKRVSLERGDFIFIPIGSYHQTFYDSGVTRILNMGVNRHYFNEHYVKYLPSHFVASQRYHIHHDFLAFIESTVFSLNNNKNSISEFNKLLTFYIVNHLQHNHNEIQDADIPRWLTQLVKEMHNKTLFAEDALRNMVILSGKTQSYLTRATRRYYGKTPGQIINDIRINFCKKQLETTNFSVADIAYDAGFNSPGLFITNFKKATTFTPGYYRRHAGKMS